MNVIQSIWKLFLEIRNLAYGEFNERGFSNPNL